MATRREHLHVAAVDGLGLTSMERHQLAAVLDDIDTCLIRNDKQLPELMWVDERSKAEIDQTRSDRPAATLSAATRKQARQLIEASGSVEPKSREARVLDSAVSTIGDTLYSVAGGAVDGVDSERQQFIDNRAALGKALTQAGGHRYTKTAVRELIDDRAREAGQYGRAAAERRTRWSARVDQIIARRDDAIAQTPGCRRRPQPSPGPQLRDQVRPDSANRFTCPGTAAEPAYPGGRAVTEIVDLHVIARLDDPAGGAVADLYGCELFYTTTAASTAAPSAAAGNPSPPTPAARPASTHSTKRWQPPDTPAPANGGAGPPAPARCGTSPSPPSESRTSDQPST
ncbi:hypothetical protein [Nocardia sp. R7R-8]|uniref:hypothetical protein n=1 Tax=Nocardia sp. R7R-8 TaxID=3459304 RepID=UPI00403D8441